MQFFASFSVYVKVIIFRIQYNMKKQVFIFGFSCISMMMIAQANDPVIMKINGKDIKKSEFEYIYKKNNNEQVLDQKTLQEYVELFKNFKLKVAEAETQGIDTTQSFRKELNEYRTQLAKPYLTDLPINENLVKQEYERSKEFIEVSHLMLNIPEKPSNEEMTGRPGPILPSDTLAVFKKAEAIYKRILKGEKFDKLVQELSEDERSKTAKQPGLLGWASALQLPETLENAIYNTSVGKVSKPAQSAFGYHLLKVDAKRQDPGQIHAAHILIMCQQGADTITVTDAIHKVDSIYNAAINGGDFAELAKQYSDDKGSGSQGGDLSWFGYGAMVPEFQDAAFALQNPGDISKPVRSQFGFHIIKLIDKKPSPSYEEKKKELISRLERSDRATELREPAVGKMKKDNGFSADEKVYKALMEKANTVYPMDSTFIATFENDESTLFLTGNTPYKVKDLITFMKGNPNSFFRLSTAFLKDKMNSFEYKSLMTEEDKNLENKYPDFKNLMNEYRDGILLFEVSNNEVWEKASKDTTGLENYFSDNKADYIWEKPHFKGYVVHCKDQKSMKKMQKQVSKMNADDAANFLLKNYVSSDAVNVKLDKVLCVQGENQYIDQCIFKTGEAKPLTNYPEAFVVGKTLNAPEAYTDVRGLVITDYQNYLEKEWISTLNKKYPVIIYQDVVNSVK